jgi:RNA polymerase sigma-70 factor (ECF subfamily)
MISKCHGMEENAGYSRHLQKEGMSLSVENVREQIVALLPRLRRFARTLARDPHDADDLVQLAIERGLAKYEQLQDEANVARWMFGIVKNAWIDEIRARARRERLLTDEEAGMNIADPAAQAHVETLAVEDALARLPDEQRLAVGLVLIEGLSYKEAAHIMEVPIGTLTSRLARARTALQEMLQGSAGERR